MKKIILTVVIILILLLGALAALIKFNVAGLGTKIIGPKLVNIPIVNLILPDMTSTTDAKDTTDTTSYNFDTIDQAVERLKATDILLKEKEKDVENLNGEIDKLNQEIDRLKVFEDNQVQFEQDKTAFDQLVAEQADPQAFMAYVQKMYPDDALKAYESIVKQQQDTAEIKSLTSMYQDMKPANAASILEQTALTNIDIVAQILLNLDPTQAGNILAAMDPTVANKISKYIYPDTNQ